MAQPQLVGPGQAVPYLTNLGQQQTATPPPALIDAVLYAGPTDYYKDDTGTHNGRWTGQPQAALWPQWDGPITVPFRLVAAPGPRPVLTSTPNSIYYGQGLFIIALPAGAAFPGEFYTHPVTGAAIPLGAIFKGLDFVGFTTGNGDGNQSGLRFDPVTGTVTPGVSVGVLVQDCLFTGNDNGVLGGAPGMTVILDTCEAFGNGLGAGGLSHELYVGPVDELIVTNLFSHSTAGTGHLLKSRAAKTTIVGPVRLLGLGGRESACLDVPDAGVLTIRGPVVMQKSATSDADWTLHYSGENQDDGSVPVAFHQPSSVDIDGLVMSCPPALTNHPSYPVLGFADQSGAGAAQSGAGSAQVAVTAKSVSVYGLTEASAGLPDVTILAAAPALDTSSPLTTPGAAVSTPATPAAPATPPTFDAPFFEDTFKTLSLQAWNNDNPPAAGSPGNWRTCYHNGWPLNTSATPPGTAGQPDVDPSARYCVGNNEAECYETSNVKLGPTGVMLIASKTPGYHFSYQPWTSGALQQSPAFAMVHGYFEVVADVPHEQGMWPAIWLLPDGHEPPEIDILEVFGTTQPADQYHAGCIDKYGPPVVPGQPNVADSIAQSAFSPGGLTQGFHKYACRWDAETIEFYVDDVLWQTCTTYADFTYPMTLILNLAVGGQNCFVGQPSVGTNPPTGSAPQAVSVMHVASARTYALPASGVWPVSGKRIPATPPIPVFA